MSKKKLPTTNYQLQTSQRGFILSFAVLLSSIILSIGLAVFNILSKELIISSVGRESQFSFYAADTSGECALFWDTKQGVFPTSSQSIVYSGVINCAGAQFHLNPPDPGVVIVGSLTSATTTFDFTSANYCARVLVAKYGDGQTKIESEGYNTCDTSSPRRIARFIRILY
ncbi:MAG: hypothetical protein AAB355_01170 [Patescibacteria group bacterium]